MERKNLSLTSKIFIGMILGIIFGLILGNVVPDGYLKDTLLLNGILKLLGSGFVNAIKMLVVPLVFVSIVCGAFAMDDIRKIGRIGLKTLVFYLFTTAMAITIALSVAKVVNPGVGINLSNLVTTEVTIAEKNSLIDILLAMISTNPVQSLATGEMLQIILFSILLGITISLVGEKGTIVKDLFTSLNEILLKMVGIIMMLAPYGVFGLLSTTFATIGFDAFVPLLKYVFVVLFALLIQGSVVYAGLLKLLSGLKISNFYKAYSKVAYVTFSTSSSNASIPASIDAMEDLGVNNSVASFTIPLGATINMDGTAIMQGAACIFISQIYGVDLGMSELLTIVLTATLASIGTAGVPGVGMITLSMVLAAVGLPLEGIGIIMGIDRILDMCRTTINVMGDCACTLIVSKQENELDLDKYYGRNAVEKKS